MLKEGQVIRLPQSGFVKVVSVNDCRARVVPIAKKQTVVHDRLHDKTVTFDTVQAGWNISPDSEVEVISE